jgi:PAS domain S-box-containing protein
MTWNYTYTPHIWPSVFTTLLYIVLVVFTWRRRNVPGALPFLIACLFGAAWAAGSALEYAAVDLAAKITWVKFQTAWQLPAATAATCFVLEYTWPGRWLTRRNLALLSIFPLFIILAILTDHQYPLIWRGFSSWNGSVIPQLGPLGWIAIAYSFVLVFLTLIAFGWLFLHSPQHRWPVAIIVAGHIVIRVVFVLQKGNFIYSTLPLDVIGLAFLISMYAIALYGFRLFDPIPLARQTAIEQLQDGMLVLDLQRRVASLNPAAERILGTPLKQVQGKPIAELLPQVPELSSPLAGAAVLSKPIEMTMGLGASTRCYELESSPLDDFRGLPVGRLLLLHDVTEQRRSQAQILKQQRDLATLHERDRLARELHDELAQDLALINLQAQLVNGLLEAGQEEQAQAQLQVLARAAREAHVDVRGEIGNLSHRVDPVEGFLGSLRHFAEAFQESCGTEIDLTLPGDLLAISFAPAAEVQLLRIVQEAFANIRKHAMAKHVQVSLTKEPGCMLLRIEDDGVGFDPDKLPASPEAFGLGIMYQRAAEVGGRVVVKSAPGKGTQVIIQVPVNEEAL